MELSELKNRTFTSDEIDEIVSQTGWVLTESEEDETITYQISELGFDDYFGEFIGNEIDGFIFNEYE